jgi:uncharacterized protein (DUF433 family)
MDWSGCEYVEQVPGRMSGIPVVVGSRVTPESVLEHADGGFSVGQIAWMFSLPRNKVRKVIEYAVRQRSQAA